jgi:hypothetical protein
MKRIKKAVATTGKYNDRNGNEKNRYVTVGSLFKRDDGSVCLKLDSVPVGPGFEGWINFYDIEDGQQSAPQTAAPQQPAPAALDDDIPF